MSMMPKTQRGESIREPQGLEWVWRYAPKWCKPLMVVYVLGIIPSGVTVAITPTPFGAHASIPGVPMRVLIGAMAGSAWPLWVPHELLSYRSEGRRPFTWTGATE